MSAGGGGGGGDGIGGEGGDEDFVTTVCGDKEEVVMD